MLTPREKSPLSEKILLRGGSNPRRCIKQDSEPNTLPTTIPAHSSVTTVNRSGFFVLACFFGGRGGGWWGREKGVRGGGNRGRCVCVCGGGGGGGFRGRKTVCLAMVGNRPHSKIARRGMAVLFRI